MLKSGGCIYSRSDKNLCYNKTMSKMRRGFTLIEVALFLAVTGLLFAGVMVGVQNSIWQQRYNDTVQNFANFLRNVYSEVSNPQSSGNGRSEELAIYGKLISFGEKRGLDGAELDANTQKVFVYDVVGDVNAAKVGSGSIIELLEKLDANAVVRTKDKDGVTVNAKLAGIVESYSPIWGSVIEAAKGDSEHAANNNLYKGSILIVRHPKSGAINTLVSDNVIEVNETLKYADGSLVYDYIDELLTSKLSTFRLEDANFCVNPYGIGENGTTKRNIRIVKNARNSSGVEIIDLDSENDKCSD